MNKKRERLAADWAGKRGYRIAWAAGEILRTIRNKLEARRNSGLIDEPFFRENLASFDFPDLNSTESHLHVIAVAVPRPAHVLRVSPQGRTIDCLIPPTYVQYRRTFDDVLADLRKNVFRESGRLEILKVPLKSLAVHMGLVSYGRNNIAYVPEYGSGFQLCGYAVTELETGRGSDREGGTVERAVDEGDRIQAVAPRESMMEPCVSCRACVKACPTGAICEERFMISAERCFTLHSESSGPIPDWIRPPSPMSLIGCITCQEICPVNKGKLKYVPAGVEFTAEETEALLDAGRSGDWNRSESGAVVSARAKFDSLGMSESAAVFGRNLALLLEQNP
jgi:epoxyqueuosine reductase